MCLGLFASSTAHAGSGSSDGALDAPWQRVHGALHQTFNQDGAALGATRASQLAKVLVRSGSRAPLIWARYTPVAGRGTITLIKPSRQLDGSLHISEVLLSPADGMSLARDPLTGGVRNFGGVNPFAQFQQAGTSEFVAINFTAFLASVGLVMRQQAASLAIVNHHAIEAWSEEAFAGVDDTRLAERRRVTLTLQPRWLIGAANEVGGGRAFTPEFRVAGCVREQDPRHQCRVPGYASFQPFDAGSMPRAGATTIARTAPEGRGLDAAAIVALFDASVALSHERVVAGRQWAGLAGAGTQLRSDLGRGEFIATAQQGEAGARGRIAHTALPGTHVGASTPNEGLAQTTRLHVSALVATDADHGRYDPELASPLADPALLEFLLPSLTAAGEGVGEFAITC
jgi:hypothetical protein